MSKSDGQLIILKNEDWLKNQRIAGKCVADVLDKCSTLVSDQTPNLSLKDIENYGLEIINKHNCIPTFLGYKGTNTIPFPSAVCLSVNEVLVHGIPSDYILKEGDKLSIDLGATFNGSIADAAYTVFYGQPKNLELKRMLDICKKALNEAIKSVAVGKRLGIIGDIIHKTVKNSGFGLIVDYGGHGLDENKPHAPPFVPNKSSINDGIMIQPGLTIAIEPMLVNGEARTRLLNDGWSIASNGIGCHFEHTIFVHEKKIEIITQHEIRV